MLGYRDGLGHFNLSELIPSKESPEEDADTRAAMDRALHAALHALPGRSLTGANVHAAVRSIQNASAAYNLGRRLGATLPSRR